MIYAVLMVLAQTGEDPHTFDCDNPRDAEQAAQCEEFFAPTVDEDPSEPDGDCDDPQTQQRMNFCASLARGVAEEQLDELWAETAAAMRRLDAGIDQEYDRAEGYLETMEQAQRGWLAYRDAHCLAESFLARGGTMQSMLYSYCMTFLTQQRIGQLRELTASLSFEE